MVGRIQVLRMVDIAVRKRKKEKMMRTDVEIPALLATRGDGGFDCLLARVD